MSAQVSLVNQGNAEVFEAAARAPRDCRIEGLPGGAYRALIVAHGYPDRAVPVAVSDGESTRLELDLDAR
jgi:hypothetical protein